MKTIVLLLTLVGIANIVGCVNTSYLSLAVTEGDYNCPPYSRVLLFLSTSSCNNFSVNSIGFAFSPVYSANYRVSFSSNMYNTQPVITSISGYPIFSIILDETGSETVPITASLYSIMDNGHNYTLVSSQSISSDKIVYMKANREYSFSLYNGLGDYINVHLGNSSNIMKANALDVSITEIL